MKSLKETLSFLFLITALITSFSACSSDDDSETPAVNDIAGTYTGYSNGACAYFSSQVGQDESVTIAANADGTANLTYNSTTWGATTIQNVKVTRTSSGYSLAGSGVYPMGHGGATNDYDCALTGSISADKKTCSVIFSLPEVMGGLTITFQNGEAPIALIVAGTYSGYTSFKMNFGTYYYDDQTFKITYNEDGTANVNFQLTDVEDDETVVMGDLKLTNVVFSEENGNYTFSTTGKMALSMSGGADQIDPTYDATITGSISSDKSTYEVKVVTTLGAMGETTMTFQNGEAPSSDAE